MGSCEQISELKTWYTSARQQVSLSILCTFFFVVCVLVFTLNHVVLSSVPKSFKYQMPN